MKRFDEVELIPEAVGSVAPLMSVPLPAAQGTRRAPLFKRAFAHLTDLSLFVALALALSPLIPVRGEIADNLANDWPSLAAMLGFLLLVSYVYFAGTWLLWGKTIGGAIFDVRITGPADGLRVAAASRRWLFSLLSVVTCGLGFLPALLPSRLSLADRMSRTRSVED